MSKKKTGAEMILDMLKQYIDEAEKIHKEKTEPESSNKDWDYPGCEDVNGECEWCKHWDENWGCCDYEDDKTEDEENEDGDAFNDCNDRDYECNQWSTEEHKQIEELSKLITSVGTVLGGNMGLLVFDKSNKKDMEKLAAIFGEYAKRLS